MIFSTFNPSCNYSSLEPGLARGFEWLASFPVESPVGRYNIAESDLFALVQSYETTPACEKKFESHKTYIDVHYVVSGSEIIYYSSIGDLQPVTPYDAEKDFTLYSDPLTSSMLQLSGGSFAVFYPQDGHKPGCAGHRISQRVRKIVLKVRV